MKVNESLFESDYALRKDVYAKKTAGNLRLYCACNKRDMPLMKISKIKKGKAEEDTIYFSNRPQNGEKHSRNCLYWGAIQGTTDYEQGWTEAPGEEEKIIVNASRTMFQKPKEKDDEAPAIENARIFMPSSERKSISTVTLRGLAGRLNLMAWEAYVKRNNRNPDSINDLLNQVYGTSRKLFMKGKQSLQDFMYSPKKAIELQTNDLLFVYMPLSEVKQRMYPRTDTPIKGVMEVSMDYFYSNGGKKNVTIQCDLNLVESGYWKNQEPKPREQAVSPYEWMVAGYVKKVKAKNGSTFFDFQSLVFLPITQQGLLVDSSYEKIAFEAAVAQGVPFYKGYLPVDGYGAFIPDMVFLNPLTPGKLYIGEVFGMGKDDYLIQKAQKIALAKDSDFLDLWQWDATATKTPPPYYP